MKSFKFDRKLWKNIWWSGPFLLVMGLTAAAVSGTWLPIPLALLIIGLVLTIAWLFTLESRDFNSQVPSFWGRRSTQTSTNALVATASVLLILALINFVGVRYSVRADLTENQLFTLSAQSQQVVRDLAQPVKVWIFDKTPNAEDKALLDRYQRAGSKFSYQYLDPNTNIGLARQFGIKELGEVYLEYGNTRKFVQRTFDTEQLSEQRLTNALGKINNPSTAVVYFLQGHGEHPLQSVGDGLAEAMRFLEQKNLTSKALNLAERGAVPRDASVVVIAGPKRPLFEQEVNVLRDYIQQGGSLLLLIDPNVNIGLEKLLAEWGVTLENRLAVDASDDGRLLGLGPATPIVTEYGTHPITKDFGNSISFYPLARPLDVKNVDNVESTPFLFSSQDSWAESNIENKELTFDEKTDRKGPLILGVALSRKFTVASNSSSPPATASPTPSATKSADKTTASPSPQASPSPSESPTASEKKEVEARLVAIGNSQFATDAMFGQQLNGDVFLNSVTWASKQENQVLSIRPKESRNRRLNMTEAQGSLLAWTSIIILPLIGFITAGFMWWRRR